MTGKVCDSGITVPRAAQETAGMGGRYEYKSLMGWELEIFSKAVIVNRGNDWGLARGRRMSRRLVVVGGTRGKRRRAVVKELRSRLAPTVTPVKCSTPSVQQ